MPTLLDFNPRLRLYLSRKRTAQTLPSALVFDNFDSGVDNATLAGRAPLVRPNANTWAVQSGTFHSLTGRAEANFAATGAAILSFDTGKTDVDIRAVLRFPTTGNNRIAGILFRYASTTNLWYTSCNLDAGVYRIVDLSSNVTNVRAEGTFAFVANTDYVIRLQVQGDNMFTTIDGVGTLSFTSSVRNTSTIHGLRAVNQVGFGSITYDNFILLEPPPVADVVITVNATPLMTSALETAVSHVDNGDLRLANATAKARALVTLDNTFVTQHQPMCSFGSSSPWPWDGTGTRPAEPTNWGSLDQMASLILQMHSRIMISTDFIPWHLKGRLFGDGHTEPCAPGDEFDKDGRVMTNQIPSWLLLIQRLAERYLPAPYNVRVWQTGIEYHGDLRGLDLSFNPIAWTAYPGTPGANADVGVSYMHNITVQKIKDVATTLGISLGTLEFIPNYPRLKANSTALSNSFPPGHVLRDQPWGTAEVMGFDAVIGSAQLVSANSTAWAVDFSLSNADGVLVPEPFDALQKFTDYLEYIKTQMAAVGVTGKKIVVSEHYENRIPAPADAGNAQYRAAMLAEAYRRFVLAGVWMPINWSIQGRDMDAGYELLGALVSDTSLSTGGVAQATLSPVKAFHTYFSTGTQIYDFTMTGTGVSAIFSASKGYLISKVNATKSVSVNNVIYTLAPYETKLIDR